MGLICTNLAIKRGPHIVWYHLYFNLKPWLEAAEHALKCRVALIQGPPGTGKTFIGCKLLQMFLPQSRVLVLTYKNHVTWRWRRNQMWLMILFVFERKTMNDTESVSTLPAFLGLPESRTPPGNDGITLEMKGLWVQVRHFGWFCWWELSLSCRMSHIVRLLTRNRTTPWFQKPWRSRGHDPLEGDKLT